MADDVSEATKCLGLLGSICWMTLDWNSAYNQPRKKQEALEPLRRVLLSLELQWPCQSYSPSRQNSGCTAECRYSRSISHGREGRVPARNLNVKRRQVTTVTTLDPQAPTTERPNYGSPLALKKQKYVADSWGCPCEVPKSIGVQQL